jgi:hypothetical protein
MVGYTRGYFSSEKLHGKCCGIGIWKGDVIEILILSIQVLSHVSSMLIGIVPHH